MDFELSEEQKMMKRNAREFLSREVAPVVDEYERKGPLSKEDATRFMKMLLPLGYMCGLVPEEYGGAGLTRVSYGLLLEELSYHWASLGGLVHITTPAGPLNCGTEEQRERILAQLLSGDLISCSAISEPNIGSSAPRSVETTAVLDGDGYIINGTKTWITNGTIADIRLSKKPFTGLVETLSTSRL
jgi:alkylation response protein AidB-like acyl-CoA dehydrogenase